jgi:hypothetical protein
VTVVAVVAITINLPRDYEDQKRFNERQGLAKQTATPDHA